MSQSDSTVLFRALPAPLSLSSREKRVLRSFARTLGSRVANGRAFTCVIAEDRELRRLNSSFLSHDYPTDILSFPSDPDLGFTSGGLAKGHDLGELIISVERAQAQAFEFGHERVSEICILILHGVLHLCGMDHARDRGEMAQAEQNWREELGLPLTLIARAEHPTTSAAAQARSARIRSAR